MRTLATTEIARRIHQPEYTGENRCLRCTGVNLFIATVFSGALWFVSEPLALASFGVFVGIIYVRGYLVPGTPTLTKQYSPAVAARIFEPAPDRTRAGRRTPPHERDDDWTDNGTVDSERLLRAIGAVTDCETEDDLCLTADFSDAWTGLIERLRDADVRTVLAKVTDTTVSEEQITVEKTGSAFSVEYDGEKGFYHGRWVSKAAFVADMAADLEIQARSERWKGTEIARVHLLEGLRVFLERCPACGGPVTTSEEVVESCCSSRSVLATACEECDVRLFEIGLAELE